MMYKAMEESWMETGFIDIVIDAERLGNQNF